MSDIVELLRQMVAIDSVNPDLVPGGAGEMALARFVASWLERAGLEVELYEVEPGRPNVVGIARGTGGGRRLLLNGHTDTVGVTGMDRPHEPRIENGKMYGRGAFDMKTGLAAIMTAAAALRERRLRGDVIITAVCDEEFASIGSRSIVERWTADAAIVAEPTGVGTLCTAHKGFAWLEVATAGVASHGSLPDVGVDAIAKMGYVLTGIERLNKRLREGQPHPLLGHGSLHASLISGGQELSSYPERCLLSIERRTIPGETVPVVEAQIQQILDEAAAATTNFSATMRTTLANDPFEIASDAEIVQLLSNEVSKQIGRQPTIEGAFGWMDSALLSAAGIPTVIYGPGGDGAHAFVEWADLDELQRCADVLIATGTSFCNS